MRHFTYLRRENPGGADRIPILRDQRIEVHLGGRIVEKSLPVVVVLPISLCLKYKYKCWKFHPPQILPPRFCPPLYLPAFEVFPITHRRSLNPVLTVCFLEQQRLKGDVGISIDERLMEGTGTPENQSIGRLRVVRVEFEFKRKRGNARR